MLITDACNDTTISTYEWASSPAVDQSCNLASCVFDFSALSAGTVVTISVKAISDLGTATSSQSITYTPLPPVMSFTTSRVFLVTAKTALTTAVSSGVSGNNLTIVYTCTAFDNSDCGFPIGSTGVDFSSAFPGVYTVFASSTDPITGLSSQVQQFVEVTRASFAVDVTTMLQGTQLTNTNTGRLIASIIGTPSLPLTYKWTLEDSSLTSSSSILVLPFDFTVGTHSATLSVTDNFGSVASSSVQFISAQPPLVTYLSVSQSEDTVMVTAQGGTSFIAEDPALFYAVYLDDTIVTPFQPNPVLYFTLDSFMTGQLSVMVRDSLGGQTSTDFSATVPETTVALKSALTSFKQTGNTLSLVNSVSGVLSAQNITDADVSTAVVILKKLSSQAPRPALSMAAAKVSDYDIEESRLILQQAQIEISGLSEKETEKAIEATLVTYSSLSQTFSSPFPLSNLPGGFNNETSDLCDVMDSVRLLAIKMINTLTFTSGDLHSELSDHFTVVTSRMTRNGVVDIQGSQFVAHSAESVVIIAVDSSLYPTSLGIYLPEFVFEIISDAKTTFLSESSKREAAPCPTCEMACLSVVDGEWTVSEADLSGSRPACVVPKSGVVAYGWAECGNATLECHCGNGVVDASEDCDNDSEDCVNCMATPGHACLDNECSSVPSKKCFETESRCSSCHGSQTSICAVCSAPYVAVNGECVISG